MKGFFKRNLIILITGLVLVGVFVGIALVSPEKKGGARLVEVDESVLVADHTYFMGSAKAPIEIVMFYNFDENCEQYIKYLEPMYKENKDLMQIAFRYYDLESESSLPNIAMQAASEKGKFWSVADKLFASDKPFQNEVIYRILEDFGIDLNQYINEEAEADVKTDFEDARKLEVSALPTAYLNKEKMEFESPFEFRELITTKIEEIKNDNEGKVTGKNVGTEENVTSLSIEEQREQQQIVTITFDNETGWEPKITELRKNQVVEFVNSSNSDIYLKQLIYGYDELMKPVLIKSGESFKFRFYMGGIWQFKAKDTNHVGQLEVARN